MGKRTEHAPGTFSWVDLSTRTPTRRRRFYGGLFDWEFEDNPIPEEAGGGVYTMCKVEGDEAAAISPSSRAIPHRRIGTTTSRSNCRRRGREGG